MNYFVPSKLENSMVKIHNILEQYLNTTPVGGGVFRPPYRKMEITPKNNDPKELKLRDFSYISMTTLPYPFWGSKWQKGVSKAFLLSAVPISGS